MGFHKALFTAVALFLPLASLAMAADTTDSAYRAEIEKWRQQREENLKLDGGWLTVAGLFWLKDGENTIGAGAGNNFVLPQGSAPGGRSGQTIEANARTRATNQGV